MMTRGTRPLEVCLPFAVTGLGAWLLFASAFGITMAEGWPFGALTTTLSAAALGAWWSLRPERERLAAMMPAAGAANGVVCVLGYRRLLTSESEVAIGLVGGVVVGLLMMPALLGVASAALRSAVARPRSLLHPPLRRAVWMHIAAWLGIGAAAAALALSVVVSAHSPRNPRPGLAAIVVAAAVATSAIALLNTLGLRRLERLAAAARHADLESARGLPAARQRIDFGVGDEVRVLRRAGTGAYRSPTVERLYRGDVDGAIAAGRHLVRASWHAAVATGVALVAVIAF